MELDKRSTFDQVAQLYDDLRPHYPEQLLNDISSLTQLSPEARILEIGAGTGIATFPLARKGYRITAIEMGTNLASVARKKLADFSNVLVLNETFEDWELPTDQFDLVISATAFHWIDPNVRWKKSAAALRAGGYLALFRYTHVAGGDRDFFRQNQHCYQQYVRGADPNFRLPEIAECQPEHVPELDDCGLFCPAEIRTYITEETYTREQYLGLLSTYSDNLILEESVRVKLFDCIGSLMEEKFNNRIRMCYLNSLIVARKR
jgi:SAM-dependent methyltransferase